MNTKRLMKCFDLLDGMEDRYREKAERLLAALIGSISILIGTFLICLWGLL